MVAESLAAAPPPVPSPAPPGTLLRGLQDEAGPFAEVISRVLQVDVEIVDEDLFRVAGTGRFADKVGRFMDAASSVYRKVVALGQPLIVREPGHAEMCRECPCWGNCEETFEMSTPILLEGAVIGVIGFVCFTEAQKEHILASFDVFFDFLAQMADLLAAKALEKRELARSRAVGELLECVVNRVDEGVLLLDADNAVIRCNKAACAILEIDEGHSLGDGSGLAVDGDVLPGPVALRRDAQDVLHYHGYELALGGRTFHVVGEEHRLNYGDCARVFVFHDAQVMHRNAYRLVASSESVGLDVLIGDSGALAALKERVRRFANASATTLVAGESGTGKELVARALHAESDRAGEVFVAVNCSAIPETLLESELFGYAGGAFTGADPRGRMGKFEQAQGGTLFLDEIGDFPLHLQPKLLRALEQREVTRIGAGAATPVDIRVIAATNRDLERMVQEGMFREDLFYRLNVLPILVPPLRARGRDVFLLARHFLERSFDRLNKSILTVRDGFWRAIEAYHWPGNVRELQNVMEYIANVADSPCVISSALLPRKVIAREGMLTSGTLHLATIEKFVISRALSPYGGAGASRADKERAAATLGIGIATLYRKIKQYGLT
ncbi:MAG: sigma 54-interacting transcriptional regulator [Desulfovibrionaceae bacterium]|nr:sigma 54-interacting transcriptional regulator [Desulfovibrionaceae bacterium]